MTTTNYKGRTIVLTREHTHWKAVIDGNVNLSSITQAGALEVARRWIDRQSDLKATGGE